MTFLNRIPGATLIFLGALCLSFGGIIVKSFEGATEWQILFWRQFFFSITVIVYLVFNYKKNFFRVFYKSGIPGFIAGLFLSIGFSAYVLAMYYTTVANTLFIITTETIFLAFFGYIFLIIIILFSFVGILKTFETDLINEFPEIEYIFTLLNTQLVYVSESVKNIITITQDLINSY